MAKRSAPEVNAGSMADIAFLLLIFFLVTTTIETDTGITRKLPPIPEENTPPPEINDRNVFTVSINKNDELLVEDKRMELKDLRESARVFLDNGAKGCDYCQGLRDPSSSDNPVKAVISLHNDRETNYGMYIAVQNELVAAYNILRNRESQRLFGTNYVDMENKFNGMKDGKDKEQLKANIKTIREMYPEKLSEAEPTKSS